MMEVSTWIQSYYKGKQRTGNSNTRPPSCCLIVRKQCISGPSKPSKASWAFYIWWSKLFCIPSTPLSHGVPRKSHHFRCYRPQRLRFYPRILLIAEPSTDVVACLTPRSLAHAVNLFGSLPSVPRLWAR
jgi:hypothetical protein